MVTDDRLTSKKSFFFFFLIVCNLPFNCNWAPQIYSNIIIYIIIIMFAHCYVVSSTFLSNTNNLQAITWFQVTYNNPYLSSFPNIDQSSQLRL